MANLADLSIGVSADTDGVASAMDDASSAVEGFEGAVESSSSFLDDHWVKIAAGAAAGAAALEGFARSQAPLRESGQRLAASLGESEEAMRDLAIEASNVTFPLDEVYAAMESGRQQGLESGEELQRFASFWDTVGDATGLAGPALADAGVALRQVGVAAGDEGSALAAFGYITENTTQGVDEFLGFIKRIGPELADMGADVDDAAAILGVLEDRGITGRQAQQAFREAIADSDGTMAGMLSTLGVSQSEFDAYGAEVAASSDIIQRNADIHADSYTPMQRLGHGAQELMHRYSGLTSVAGTMAAGLGAVVPVLTSVMMTKRLGAIASAQSAATEVAANSATKASMLSTAAAKTAAWARMGAQSLLHAAKIAVAWLIAMGPIVLVIAAVVGLAILIVKNWDWIKTKTIELWEKVKEVFGRLVAWVKELPGKIFDAIKDLGGKVLDFIVEYHPVAVLHRKAMEWWPRLKTWFTELPGKILAALRNLGRLLVGAGRSILEGLWTGLKEKWQEVRDWVGGLGAKIKNLKGPIQADRKLLADEGSAIMEGLGRGLADGWGDNEALLETMASQIRDTFSDATIPGVQIPGLGPLPVRGGDGAAAGLGGGVHVEHLDISNPVGETTHDSVNRSLRTLTHLYGGG